MWVGLMTSVDPGYLPEVGVSIEDKRSPVLTAQADGLLTGKDGSFVQARLSYNGVFHRLADESGVDPKDVSLAMAQVNCSRAEAVKALKESGGNLSISVSLMFYFYFQLIVNTLGFSHSGDWVVYQLSSCSSLIDCIALKGVS